MAKKAKTHRRPRVRGVGKSGLTGLATSALIGGVGAVVFKMVADKVLPAQYAQYSNYVQLAGGLAVASFVKNPMVQAAGLGAATVGAANVVGDLTDGQPANVNLLPPGQQTYGIRAHPEYRVAGNPEIIMQ